MSNRPPLGRVPVALARAMPQDRTLLVILCLALLLVAALCLVVGQTFGQHYAPNPPVAPGEVVVLDPEAVLA